VLGTDELNAYLNKYHLELDPQLDALVGRYYLPFDFLLVITNLSVRRKTILQDLEINELDRDVIYDRTSWCRSIYVAILA